MDEGGCRVPGISLLHGSLFPTSLHGSKLAWPTPSLTLALKRGIKGTRRAIRLFPLLLMTIYAASFILRIATSPSSSSSSSSQWLHAPNLLVREKTTASRSSEKHIITSPNHTTLRAPQEGRPPVSPPCSALINGDASATAASGVLCCDRSHFRTDVCYMKGDVRADPRSSSIFVHGTRGLQPPEAIRPYTRKWEAGIMATVDELTLVPVPSDEGARCDVRHGVPGVVFSTGGYTGNVYHEFSDGLLPLYATAERFRGEVVLVVLEYHAWWMAKYGALVRSISSYNVVDFARDRRVHCFPEVIVGLRIHGELTIDPHLMPSGKGIHHFQELLNESFGRSRRKEHHQSPLLPNSTTTSSSSSRRKPRLVILVRNRSRILLNLRQVVKASQSVGFEVQVLNPKMKTPMPDLYEALHSADAMLAVHGAAVTHFLFMRPGSVIIQIVPLGLDWAAEEFYGRPARRLGLEYMEYKVLPEESSLWRHYDRHDPVIANPVAVAKKGWLELKKVYLDHQNVRVNIRRFRKVLARAYSHVNKSQP